MAEVKNNIALKHFEEGGKLPNLAIEFPTTRNEYWKYTRLGVLKNRTYFTSNEAQLNFADIETYVNPNDYQVVFIENGKLRTDLSDTNGIELVDQLPEPKMADYFVLLNHLFSETKLKLTVNKNTVLEKPLLIVNSVSTDLAIANTNIGIELKSGSKATVLVLDISTGSNGFLNSYNSISVANNAALELIHLQDHQKGNQIHNLNATVRKHGSFKNVNVGLSGNLLRNNLNVYLNNVEGFAALNGALLPSGNAHFDTHTFIDHKKPHCNSSELYRGVLQDTATGVFNGKVLVRPDAQKTNAFQANNNLLLSDKATINSKPELEIYADDVKCSHGSTTGQLDEAAVFYLQSRGVRKEEAVKLLVKGFVKDVLEPISNERLRENIEKLMEYSLDD